MSRRLSREDMGMLEYPALPDIRAKRIRYRYRPGDEFSWSGCGVYFLFLRWALVYVGQSIDVDHRLQGHWMQRRIPFNKVGFVEFAPDHLDVAELHYIEKHTPRFNFKDNPLYRVRR